MKKAFLLLTVCFMLSGCNMGGVSEEEYNALLEERDQYKEIYGELNSETTELLGEETTKISLDEDNNDSKDTDDLTSQVEVNGEYWYTNSIGATLHYIIVKNNSSNTVDVSVNVTAKDASGKIIGADSSSVEAIGSGCETCVYSYFSDTKDVASFDYTMNVNEAKYYESVIQDIEYQQSITDKKVILTCTNKGSEAAEFVEAYALFLSNGELVYSDSTYIVDSDNEIKPGATISKELKSYQSFDDVKVFFTGRK